MVLNKEDFDWPGWHLEDNPFGAEFDEAARKRMIKGSQALLPFLKKYKKDLGKIVLEVGSFFNPLVTPDEFRGRKIFYWENDRNVLSWLKKKYSEEDVFAIYCDLNKIEEDSFIKLKIETANFFKKINRQKIEFDAIVVSHVFNYIDYKLFLAVIRDLLRDGGLIFINNVVDYGLPEHFSDKRPKSIKEIIQTLEDAGYEIIEKDIIDSPYPQHQKNKRLILAARK